MFRVFGDRGLTRRSFVQAGVLGVGGLTLPELFRVRAAGASRRPPDTAVILFWLSGGPGHMETWDPKPDAVAAVPRPVRRDPHRACPASSSASCCPSRRRSRTSSRSSAASTTAPATTPRATTGCSPASRGRPSTPRTSTSSAGRASARRRRGSAAPNRPGMPRLRRRARTSAAAPTTSSTTRPTSAAAYNPFVVESDPNDPKFRVRNLTLPAEHAARPPGGPPRAARTLDRPRQAVGRRRTAGPRRRTRSGRSRCSPARTRRRPSTSPPSRPRSATATAGTPSARAPCWPGGWSRPASRSSRSTACRGTTTATAGRLTTEEAAKLLIPPLDPALAALVDDLIDRGPVRVDAGRGDGRVRPHAADEHGRRPRPLGQHVQRADGLRVDADGPGDRPQQRRAASTRRTGRSARRTWPRRSTTTSASTPARWRSRTRRAGRST